MSHVKIDISRGMEVSGSPGGPGSATPSLPFLRRRKGLVLIVVLSVVLLLVVNRSHIPEASSSIRWVKDSMRTSSSASDQQHDQAAPPSAPLPNDFGVGVAQQDASLGSNANGATDAFRKLAKEQGYTPEEIEKLAAASGPAIPQGPPTSAERLLLFFYALSNPSYTVPSWEYTWRTHLVPLSEKAFARSLTHVGGEAGQADVTLYTSNRAQWNAIHRKQNPLTVFSKSYCPFSRKAKDLLDSLGARYHVIEVDLRPKDAQSVQSVLATLSGHHTFPAVFAGDKLLGGFDDIQTLNQLKVLPGMLKATGAL